MHPADQPGDIPPPDPRTILIDILLIGLIGALVTTFSLWRVGPEWLNADTMLHAIISLQNLTLFYWGQNRLINLVPLIAYPIRQPDPNLFLQIQIFGIGFVGLLALIGRVVAEIVFNSRRRLDAWLCFGMLLAAFLVISSDGAIHTFVVNGQPYGLSGLIMGLALFRFLKSVRLTCHDYALLPLAMLTAGGLNPTLMFPTAALCLTLVLFAPDYRYRALWAAILIVVSCAAWVVLPPPTPGLVPYGDFTTYAKWANIVTAARALLGMAFDPIGFAVLVWSAFAVFIIGLCRGRSNPARTQLGGFLALFALAWQMIFPLNSWVVFNDLNYRYFYPVILIITGLIATPLCAVLITRGTSLRSAATALAFVGALAMIVAPIQSWNEFPVFTRVKQAAAVAQAQDIRFVAGDYWWVWPTIFLLQRDGEAYGIESFRGLGNAPGIMRALADIDRVGRPARALCLNASHELCRRQAAMTTGREWHTATQPCGAKCLMIEAANREQ